MSHAATLPAGWTKILDDIRRHLDDAVAATDARIATMPIVIPDASGAPHRQALAEIGQHLLGLHDHLRSTEQVIEATDKVLLAEETFLREHRAVGKRLTDWAVARGAR